MYSYKQRDIIKTSVKLLLFCAIYNIVGLFSDAALWDSLILKNALDSHQYNIIKNGFNESGRPLIGKLHIMLAQTYNYVYSCRVLVFVCTLVLAQFLFLSLIELRIFSISDCFFISLISVIYPSYTLRFEPMMLSYNVSFAVYFLALYIYLKHITTTNIISKYVIFSIPLFFIGFYTESILIFHYGVFLAIYFVFYYDHKINFISLISFLRTNLIILFYPLLFYILKSILTPCYGPSENYNHPDFNPIEIIRQFTSSIPILVFEPFKYLIDINKFIPLLVFAVVIGCLVIFVVNKDELQERKYKNLYVLLYSLILIFS